MPDTGTEPRHALVTGTSSGIGRVIAERLIAEGWRVTGFDRAAPTLDVRAFKGIAVDVTDRAELRAAVQSLTGITALVHAAGILRVGKLGALDHDDGALMWRLHVEAACLLADALAPLLPAGGRIVLIGSRVASGAAGRSQYAATKAALVALARSWAIELAPRAITVNVVAPGATDTPMLQDPARAGTAPRLPPIGRFIQPAEVAATVSFLLTEAASAITGEELRVCGGSSLV